MNADGPGEPVARELRAWGVTGLPEIRTGDDLAALLADAVPDLRDGDVVVVSSKVVSKAEGRVVDGTTRADAVRAETVRLVAARGETRIVQTRHGFVMAAAGVDASNVAVGRLVLLPLDADESARRLRRGLAERRGVDVGVVVTDTFGRPWRVGQVDLAVGAAGVHVVDDHQGRVDAYGNELAVTAPALADELAAAADLVKGKLAGVPVAVVRGLSALVIADDGPGVAALVRSADQDLFRLGTAEAMREALRLVPSDRLADTVPDPAGVEHVLELAQAVREPAVRLVRVDDPAAGKELLAAAGASGAGTVLVVTLASATAGVDATGGPVAAGALRERLLRAAAVEGYAARWVGAGEAGGLLDRWCVDAHPVGAVVVGAPEPAGE